MKLTKHVGEPPQEGGGWWMRDNDTETIRERETYQAATTSEQSVQDRTLLINIHPFLSLNGISLRLKLILVNDDFLGASNAFAILALDRLRTVARGADLGHLNLVSINDFEELVLDLQPLCGNENSWATLID